MRMRRVTWIVGEKGRLDEVARLRFEAELARSLSRAAVRRLIMAGVIRGNGRPLTRPSAEVDAGVRLTAVVDLDRLPPLSGGADVSERALDVLYEDDSLLAVAKPPGLPTHATADPDRADLYSLVKRRLLPPGAYLGLHHRLDRDTSGVVLFTRRPEVNAHVAAQFEGRQVVKIYHALTLLAPGRRRDAWRVENRLGPVGAGRTARTGEVERGGQPAVTEFRVLERLAGALLVEARPKTGRKHQIRAHLEAGGTPILGDSRYGGAPRLADVEIARPMLHARRLELRHPVGQGTLVIECAYPADYQRVLARLQRRVPRVPRLDMSGPTR
jgi:23S rRNA pseudouridine955/2504/2580 synthase